MKSFKDANKVKTLIGDLVSMTTTWNGQAITEGFIVKAIEKDGPRVEVVLENEVYGVLRMGSKFLVNEM